ncbi:MAG TPA: S8 family serine peptidase [Gemmataceae bacterium]|nr:S8 family serine peptidase [Gemmataceae bacterium]
MNRLSPRLFAPALLALVLPAVPAVHGADETLSSRGQSATLTTERARHLTELGVDRWLATGATGRGIKVAVLDSGLRGYKDQLGKALPAKVSVRSFRKDGNLEARDSQHGILCGEVIHALAPDAELLFANWEEDDADTFLQAVRWARAQGAQVISCSVIMPSHSDGEGGGPVHRELARILGSGERRGDVLFFASAGNTAERHWAGRFHAGADGFQEWRPGVVENTLTPWGKDRVAVELCCKTGTTYELIVSDAEGGSVVARSGGPVEAGSDCRVARFLPTPGHTYRLRVRLVSGKPGSFHVVALACGLKETNAAGSVAFPADGAEVIAVGAVDHAGRRAAYSACGSADGRTKPDLVAPVPFASAWRARPFAGTSAAAPQAAAVAALMWSRSLDWTADKVRATLRKSAKDLGPPGYDAETGFGLLQLPAAADARSSAKVP